MVHEMPAILRQVAEVFERMGTTAETWQARSSAPLCHATSADELAGRDGAIFAERDLKLEIARERRRKTREIGRQIADGARPCDCLCAALPLTVDLDAR
jgi:hypothetical protein